MSGFRALVGGIPSSFDRATVRTGERPFIDVTRARAQHDAYVAALRAAGVAITRIEPDPALPDGVFVEDQAVVAAGTALITRSGNPSRRAEAAHVATALREHTQLRIMVPPARLDGGDVLRVGRTLFVGRSQRTDPAGVTALRGTFEPLGFEVVEVEVADSLHLKCHVSTPDPQTVLLAPGWVDPAPFEACARVLRVPDSEAYAANVVGVGGTVLVAAGYPATSEVLGEAGFRVHELDTSEIRKADGSLTCMSVFF